MRSSPFSEALFTNNLKSMQETEGIVKAKIQKKITDGRVLGPYQHAPLENLQVLPLGVKNKEEYRLIHHLSYLEGESVNNAILQELCMVHYTSFDELVRMVRRCGIGA